MINDRIERKDKYKHLTHKFRICCEVQHDVLVYAEWENSCHKYDNGIQILACCVQS